MEQHDYMYGKDGKRRYITAVGIDKTNKTFSTAVFKAMPAYKRIVEQWKQYGLEPHIIQSCGSGGQAESCRSATFNLMKLVGYKHFMENDNEV